MIRTTNTFLEVAVITHPGMPSKQNEDRFAVSSYRVSKTDAMPPLFAIVSDGIGGHRAGLDRLHRMRKATPGIGYCWGWRS